MDKNRIRTVLKEEEANLTDIIDMVIEDNGIVGVGKITLAEQISNYILYGIFHTVPKPTVLKLDNDSPSGFSPIFSKEQPDLIDSEFDKPENIYEQS
jgi:hypothetical protein